MRTTDGSKCEAIDVRVYRQSREAGRGCLVSVPATDNADGRGPSREYQWVLGWPATAHEIHPQEQ